MTWVDRVEQVGGGLVVAAVVGIVSGFWYLLRVLFTNQKEIEMLKAVLDQNSRLRAEDRETLKTDIGEVKDRLKSIEASLMHGGQ